jgi:hypothetical protein
MAALDSPHHGGTRWPLFFILLFLSGRGAREGVPPIVGTASRRGARKRRGAGRRWFRGLDSPHHGGTPWPLLGGRRRARCGHGGTRWPLFFILLFLSGRRAREGVPPIVGTASRRGARKRRGPGDAGSAGDAGSPGWIPRARFPTPRRDAVATFLGVGVRPSVGTASRRGARKRRGAGRRWFRGLDSPHHGGTPWPLFWGSA